MNYALRLLAQLLEMFAWVAGLWDFRFSLHKIILQTGHGEICDFVHHLLIFYCIWQISFYGPLLQNNFLS